ARELEQGLRILVELPVVPTDLVILRVGVVVAALRTADLVAPAKHGHTLRAEQGHQEVALLAFAHLNDSGVFRGSLGTVVGGMIVVGSVAIVFAVGLVVLAVITHQVMEREAIVSGHKIDAGGGVAAIALVEVARPGEPVAELGKLAIIALPVAT